MIKNYKRITTNVLQEMKENKEKIKEISFGKNRLRSETAGVFAVSIINNFKTL